MKPNSLPSDHPAVETLLAYLDDALEESAQEVVELHLARCDDCCRHMQRAADLGEIWGSWNATAHRATAMRARLIEALEEIEQRTATGDGLRQRLQQWRQLWSGSVEGALRVFVDRSLQAAQLAVESVDELRRSGGGWDFEPQLDFGGAWGADNEELASVVVVASPASAAGEPRALVELRGGEDACLTVRIDELSPGTLPPLILLVPVGSDSSFGNRIELARATPGSDSAVARFRDLPEGTFLIAIEPCDVPPTG